jgi:transcriptional regulator with XRE-family HTH domain
MPRMKTSSAISAEDVKRIRREMGISQTELARGMCLGADAIRKWEQAVSTCRGPSAVLLRMLPTLSPKVIGPAEGRLPPEFVELVRLVHGRKNGNGHKRRAS